MAQRDAQPGWSRYGTGGALAALTALGTLLSPAPAEACGGFFCGRQPVDQTAERILFEVGQDTVRLRRLRLR